MLQELCRHDRTAVVRRYRDFSSPPKRGRWRKEYDFTSDDFAAGLVKGFSFLAEGEMPYLVHCREGKDRAGFAIMVLEALMGWNESQITADYMQTYTNYYGIEPGTEKYNLIAEKNIMKMLCFMADLDSETALAGIDLQAAAETLLLRNGMDEETLKRLEVRLTSDETR